MARRITVAIGASPDCATEEEFLARLDAIIVEARRSALNIWRDFTAGRIAEPPRSGVERIADERARQLGELGWSEEHDDGHDRGELGYAATCYATPPWERIPTEQEDLWPWPDHEPPQTTIVRFSERDQPDNIKQRVRELEKAGALVAAEIDRLLRLEQ